MSEVLNCRLTRRPFRMSVAERLKKLQRDHTKCLLGRLEELIPPEFTSKAAAQRSAGKRCARSAVPRARVTVPRARVVLLPAGPCYQGGGVGGSEVACVAELALRAFADTGGGHGACLGGTDRWGPLGAVRRTWCTMRCATWPFSAPKQHSSPKRPLTLRAEAPMRKLPSPPLTRPCQPSIPQN